MRPLAVDVVYKSFSWVSVSEFSELDNSENWWLALFPHQDGNVGLLLNSFI